jgi:N-acyl-L-homoserine lactone synthetase
LISYDELTARELTTRAEFSAMAELRHDVYSEEQKWVEPKRCKLEIDKYDSTATVYHGVFYKECLVACQRLNQRPGIWMVDPGMEYDNIGATIKNLRYSEDSAEASRLTIHKKFRSIFIYLGEKYYISVILLLFRESFRYCQNNGIRFVYGGTYVQYIDHYRRFAPFKRVSEVKRMADNLDIEVAVLDLDEFECGMPYDLYNFFHFKYSALPAKKTAC